MYHLIVGAVAVAIGAAVTLGGMWYGGPIYTTAKTRADLIAIEGQAQQIAAAMMLYEQDHLRLSLGEDAVALDALQSAGYLKDVPPGSWSIKSPSSMWRPISQQDAASCAAMNKVAGHDAVCPPCDSESDTAYPVCQQPL
jgi:hypothetical protein